MEENEKIEHTEEHVQHNKKKEKELSLPMAIVLGAFLIAIAIIVVKMPARTVTTTEVAGNSIDATALKAMVNHVLSSKNATPVVPVTESDHIQGTKTPSITIIEYSDLECPFCKNFDTTMNKVIQNYGDRVDWVYRHFPLDCVDDKSDSCTPLHPKARNEAIASECAFDQGGNDMFWQYITNVFSITPSNNRLDPEQLNYVAKSLNLNMDDFAKCMKSDKYAKAVSEDAKAGLKSSVRGTPNSIIVDKSGNTYTVSGAYPYEVMSGVLDTLLKN